MSPGLSVIIVHYKTPELLDVCISSLYGNAENVDLEVIVVNNDEDITTGDRLTVKFPSLIWIEAGYNAGFSRANNMGIRQATKEYVLILNPDAEIKEGFLQRYLDFYKEKDKDNKLGQVGCRVVSSVDGHLQVGTGEGFPSVRKLIQANPVYIYLTRSRAKVKSYDAKMMHYTTHEVDFVSGSCVMIRRDKIVKSDLYFDEDFFLYSEDVEWSYRIKKAGYKNYFLADIQVYHVNSASTGISPDKKFQMQISMYLYYLKSFGLLYYMIIGLILWINFKMDLYFLLRGSSESYDLMKAQYDVFKAYFTRVSREYYPLHKKRQYLRYS